MFSSDAATQAVLAEGRRVLVHCNACGYCNGYCPVFDLARRRAEFSLNDLHFLSNLCHDCGACRDACQYAPPHDFDVDVPAALSSVRQASYQAFARPAWLGRLIWRGSAWRRWSYVLIFLSPLIVLLLNAKPVSPVSPSLFEPLPVSAMALIGGVPFLWGGITTLAAAFAFQRALANLPGDRRNGVSAGRVLAYALSLRQYGAGNDSCSRTVGGPAGLRKALHHSIVLGFLLCALASFTAAVYHHVLGLEAPYPHGSLPVILGSVGGAALVLGCGGTILLSCRRKDTKHKDGSFVRMLLFVALSGMLVLALRQTYWGDAALALHLAAVCVFFFFLPYGQFVHGPFRFLALLRAARELQSSKPH
ncbi:tricarballylate utilization 4Fe-4S protein TcuB [Dongia sp.]|uniref:tricarballylate utilization 4Fe-4S protein TcuB n=1 Tax=Dongia sp. TaxID=1977262 RepID=UPI0035AE17D7